MKLTEGPRLHLELTEGLQASKKDDGSRQKVSRPYGMLMEVNQRSLGPTETSRKFTEGLSATRNVDGRSSVLTVSWRMLTFGLPAIWKLDGSWRKISLQQENLTEDDGRSRGITDCRRKAFCPHGKFTEVDGRSSGRAENWRNLTKDLSSTWKLYRSWLKIFWLHKNLREVDGMSLRAQKLTEVVGWSEGCTESWHKVFWLHGKFTEADGQSCGSMESWQKLTEDLTAGYKIDGSWSW